MFHAFRPLSSIVCLVLLTAGCSRDSLLSPITIEFPERQYTFSLEEVAQGVEIPYTITIHQDLPGAIPTANDIGNASLPGPSGLSPFEIISGGGHEYSLRDIGLGPPRDPEPRTIKRGTFQQRFAWDGRNWNGPSDYQAPKGPPFPPGSYTLTVRAIVQQKTASGSVTYILSENVPVQLTP